MSDAVMGLMEIKRSLALSSAKLRINMLKILELEAKKSINLNFRTGGHGRWDAKSRPDGRAILTGRTGRLQRTVSVFRNDKALSIILGSNLPYSQIHNEGGVIQRKAGTIKLRKTKKGNRFASYKHKRAVRTVSRRAYSIRIPKREFLVIFPEDIPRINKALANVQF